MEAPHRRRLRANRKKRILQRNQCGYDNNDNADERDARVLNGATRSSPPLSKDAEDPTTTRASSIRIDQKREDTADSTDDKKGQKRSALEASSSSSSSVDSESYPEESQWVRPLPKYPRQSELQLPERLKRASERSADLIAFRNQHKKKYGKACVELELALFASALGTLNFPPLVKDDEYVADTVMRATMQAVREVSLLALKVLSNAGNASAIEKVHQLENQELKETRK